MKIRFRYLLPVLILCAAGAWYRALAGRTAPPETTPATVKTPEVEVQAVQFQTLRPEISAYGTVTPATEATLTAEVTGSVIRVGKAFHVGGVFRKGQVMVEVEKSDYKAAVAEAEAALARVRRELASEMERARQAEIDWRDLGRGTPTDLALRKPQLKEAEAQVRAAEAGLERARRNLSRTKIRAPFTGLVTRRNVTLGGYVSSGSSVATLAGLDSAEIRLLVPASDAALLDLPRTDLAENGISTAATSSKGTKEGRDNGVSRANAANGREEKSRVNKRQPRGKPLQYARNTRTGEKSSFYLKNQPHTAENPPYRDEEGRTVTFRLPGKDQPHTWSGTIVRTEGSVDPATRLLCVVARIGDPYGIHTPNSSLPQLLFGSFVSARIPGAAVENAVALPPHLVGETGKVWTVARGDRLRLKPVNVLRREQDRVIVTGGLSPAEQISKIRFPEGMEGRFVIIRNLNADPTGAAFADSAAGYDVNADVAVDTDTFADIEYNAGDDTEVWGDRS